MRAFSWQQVTDVIKRHRRCARRLILPSWLYEGLRVIQGTVSMLVERRIQHSWLLAVDFEKTHLATTDSRDSRGV